MRIAVQLIIAQSGEHIWAENYDHVLDDILTWRKRLRTPSSPPSHRRFMPQRMRVRVACARTILMPTRWPIMAGPATHSRLTPTARWPCVPWQWWHAYHNTTNSLPQTLALGLTAATRAVAIDPGDHQTRRWRGLLLAMAKHLDEGLAELRRAHDINLNYALTLSWLGLYEAMHGDAAKGVPYALEGLRLSPRDPALGTFIVILGFAQFILGDYAAAAASAQTALREASGSAVPHVLAAISRVGTGEIELATAAFQTLQQIAPKLDQARLDGQWLSSNPN